MTVPLPPLPSFGDEWHTPPAGRSIVDILAEEHHRLRGLCTRLDRLARRGARAGGVCDVLTAGVVRHLSAEEQYLYPTVRAVLPDGHLIADREIVADDEMLRTLRRLATRSAGSGGRAADPAYQGLVRALCGQVTRHAHRADRQILARLAAVCSESDLVRLGNRAEIATEAAPTRPHPSAPSRPPWNKLTDPALGVVDKLRDALSGRATYPTDLS